MAKKKKSNKNGKKKIIGWNRGYVLYRRSNGSLKPYSISPSKLIAMLDGNRGDYIIVKNQSENVLLHAKGGLEKFLKKLDCVNIPIKTILNEQPSLKYGN